MVGQHSTPELYSRPERPRFWLSGYRAWGLLPQPFPWTPARTADWRWEWHGLTRVTADSRKGIFWRNHQFHFLQGLRQQLLSELPGLWMSAKCLLLGIGLN